MQARPVIGLTGGIGAGKSTAAKILGELGAYVIDADKVGHDVYAPGTGGFRAVVEAFGSEIVAADGTIDRRRLGTTVFADPAQLRRLNGLVHPLIGLAIRERLMAAQAEAARTPIVVEAAIMMEAGWTFFDEVWAVIVEPETAIARVTASRGLSRVDVEQRLAAQMTNDERVRRATRVIHNDGTPAALRAQVEAAWRAVGGS
ncbi:MAG: dephospho-CoA kinase [bacterium]|nr:dephospho-CoA kinase [bacterium]